MDSERWQKIKGLFGAAMELPPVKRRKFLDNACRSEFELRAEVERMINLSEVSADFLEAPAVAAVAELILEEKDLAASGERVSHYEIISEIGAGGMGKVYLAEDTRLKRKVALKFLTGEFCEDENLLRRFEQEAQTVSALSHPNILTVYEIGQSRGRRFIVSEYVEGETLRGRLERDEPFELLETLRITIQIAGALRAAHDAGIVHRDIKPENIALREDGLVKVLDFGLAKPKSSKSTDSEADTRIRVQTLPGIILGTSSYMSPEQTRGKSVDGRTDIWSLGIVLYEMLGGRLPFAGETASDRIASILMTEPKLELLPEQVRGIVAKALRKNRAERYQTVKEMQADLLRLEEDSDLSWW